MMKFSLPVAFIVISLSLGGCKENEELVGRAGEIISDRVVLVEDFTAVRCPNCPKAATEIKSLEEKYPENIVTIAYHTGNLANPITKQGFESKYDFRTDEGQELESSLGGFLGQPAIGINRKKFDPQQELILSNIFILGNFDTELKSIPKVKISIKNNYDATSRKLLSAVTIIPQVASTGQYRLHALLTESHILDSQEDQTSHIKDYEHNHVFRKMLSDITGDEIGLTLTPGKDIVRFYEFYFPPEAGWWVAENCSFVAFVSDLDLKTYEVGAVIQAAEEKVAE